MIPGIYKGKGNIANQDLLIVTANKEGWSISSDEYPNLYSAAYDALVGQSGWSLSSYRDEVSGFEEFVLPAVLLFTLDNIPPSYYNKEKEMII